MICPPPVRLIGARPEGRAALGLVVTPAGRFRLGLIGDVVCWLAPDRPGLAVPPWLAGAEPLKAAPAWSARLFGDEAPLEVWQPGTAFRHEVWQALLAIPCGETRSYGEIAERVGRPGGARAVGQAVGANAVPWLIPCHRVLAACGLGGYHWGPTLKRRLLALEGVVLPD